MARGCSYLSPPTGPRTGSDGILRSGGCASGSSSSFFLLAPRLCLSARLPFAGRAGITCARLAVAPAWCIRGCVPRSRGPSSRTSPPRRPPAKPRTSAGRSIVSCTDVAELSASTHKLTFTKMHIRGSRRLRRRSSCWTRRRSQAPAPRSWRRRLRLRIRAAGLLPSRPRLHTFTAPPGPHRGGARSNLVLGYPI